MVLHWIDNSGAVASAVHGYARPVDSARIMHALHSTLADLQVRAWFEYVRTAANVADEPSRVDLSQLRYAFRCVAPEVAATLGSEPVDLVLPAPRGWADAGSRWTVPRRRGGEASG
jgi:hypothetical protein